MNIEGKRLPVIKFEHARVLDVWRMDDGVALTLSDTAGGIYAGCQITKENWDAVVEFIRRQFVA